MRILIVSQYFWPEQFRVNDVAIELASRGHNVTVLTGLPNYPDGEVLPSFRADPGRFALLGDVDIIRIPILPRGRGTLRLLLNYLSFVVSGLILGTWRLRGRKFDVIFMFETSPITSAIPALLLRHLKRAPLLMWVLDLWPETLSAVGVVRSERALRLIGRLVAFIYERCDRILIQSRAFEQNVRTYSRHPERIRYFPAWAEIGSEGGADTRGVAAELAPYSGTFNILFAGNIGEAQDFPAVLEAVEALRDVPELRWFVVGSGRAQPELEAEIAARGLGDHIILLGRHPIERMPSFFAGADALLVSLRDDPIFALTIPGKVQTYLSSGRPLLGMLDGEGARVIEQAGAGLTCPAGDGRALALRVRELMAMPTERRLAMAESGMTFCREHFDRQTLIASLERWMKELISARRESARGDDE